MSTFSSEGMWRDVASTEQRESLRKLLTCYVNLTLFYVSFDVIQLFATVDGLALHCSAYTSLHSNVQFAAVEQVQEKLPRGTEVPESYRC